MSQTKYNLYSNNFESFCIMRVCKNDSEGRT